MPGGGRAPRIVIPAGRAARPPPPPPGGEWPTIGRYRLDCGTTDSVQLVATGVGAATDAMKIDYEGGD